jgi:hypothetical protein
VGGSLDHCPILLQLEKEDEKPPGPFKFNHAWIGEEDFHRLIYDNWKPFNPSTGETAMSQFVANLKHVKKLVANWDKNEKGFLSS